MRLIFRCAHCVRILTTDSESYVAGGLECECGAKYSISIVVEAPVKEAQNGQTPADNID